jgi:cyclopropane-fatty-acyl-phospholipid synthase
MAITDVHATAGAADSHTARSTLELIDHIFRDVAPPDFAIRLWDGSEWSASPDTAPRTTLVLRGPHVLRQLLRPRSEAALARLHLAGEIDIEGDIFGVLPVGRAILSRGWTWRELARLGLRIATIGSGARAAGGGASTASAAAGDLPEARLRGARHSLARDRDAVTHHYNVSNRFYSLFLGRYMAYSCAIFAHADEDLDTAQRRKLDTVCRKLRLEPGHRFLDIGCGWGSQMMCAARGYGVEAVGITLSERQAELARARLAEVGLGDRCHVELRDWRSLEGAAAFDRIASVGMFEHVGRAQADEYFRTVHRLLRPGGAYLHHAIAAHAHSPRTRRPTTTGAYVFPDHELLPIGETLMRAEAAGFEVRDVENIREHYALTLRRWIAVLEERRTEAVAEVGEATWRAWRLVFAGSAEGFERNRQAVVQTLLVKPTADGRAGVPLGRADWYG